MNKNDALKNVHKTISDYNLIADKFSSTRHNITRDIINLVQNVDQNSTVLDYGCGNGRVCKLFEPKSYRGVDPSEELIKIAKLSYPEYSFSIIKPLEIPHGCTYDAVICLSMIHHVTNRDLQLELLNGFYQILKNNGRIILSAWNLSDLIINKHKLVHKPFIGGEIKIDRLLYAFDLDELVNLVQNAGFKVINSGTTPRNKGKYSNLEIVAKKN